MPLQTLVTGFGPFGNVVSNPTERLLDALVLEEIPGHELTVQSLPTSFERAPQVMRAALEIGGRGGQPFDILLMLGVAPGSPCWRVERVGRNRVDSERSDVDGRRRVGSIVPGGPETLEVHLPVERMLAALEQAGLPARLSESAGEYVCNYLLYTTLGYLQASGNPARAGFLHVPADEQTFRPGLTSAPMVSFAAQQQAVRAVLKALA
jgi:pyroglutamyl-peptidase